MEYIIRFAQWNETFRQAEIEALATLVGVDFEFVVYDKWSPYCIVKFPDDEAARKVVSRSIVAQDVYQLWGKGATNEEMHADTRSRTEHFLQDYRDVSFSFKVDTYGAKRSQAEKNQLIVDFAYLGFKGPIDLKTPDVEFVILEDYVTTQEWLDKEKGSSAQQDNATANPKKARELKASYFGRWICASSREVVDKYDLKKRSYIATTSMEAELSLVTANMALAAPGKIFFDPFVGTGSLLLAAAHFGAMTLGADIDGRSFRGKSNITKDNPMGLFKNFKQYGTESFFIDAFASDLTNTPIRNIPFLDGIVCDPPYGIREGLKVLGRRDGQSVEAKNSDGVPNHLQPGYFPPKKPYGFLAMQRDILNFAAQTLVEGGRIAMWMPTANDQDVELMIPTHPSLEIVNVSVQQFNKWARRLLTYRKLREGEVSSASTAASLKDDPNGVTANELNEFRRKYFASNQ